jgi:putative transcriptional regulator
MGKNTDSIDLNGKLLIAMPGMSDPRFASSVIFMCAHSDEGSMGLIVNKPTLGLKLADLLEQLDITTGDSGRDIRVHFGGPVEHGRGFVLHSTDYTNCEATLEVDEQFGMTATQDILEALAGGTGPDAAMLMLGYAGWEPGQLENEIKDNGWLVADATPQIVFELDSSAKWMAAIKSLGIDPLMLSATAGRA